MLKVITSRKWKYLYQQEQSLKTLESDITHAQQFIQLIQAGDLASSYPGTDTTDTVLNNPLATSLITMRDQMKIIAKKESERTWTTEGLANFAEILRSYQTDIDKLYDNILTTLVKYVKANQGGLFIVNTSDISQTIHIEQEAVSHLHSNKSHKTKNNANTTLTTTESVELEMVACYAYDRKKYIHKKIGIGEGLTGQCYLEAETIYLTDIPADYLNITSGLGTASPSSVLIVPLKLDEKVQGVLELASFNKFETYQIEFIEKLGESIASTISNTRASLQTRQLLEMSQKQAMELKSQEEVMRQNLEEMAATQEEIKRRETDGQNLLIAFQTIMNTFASIEFDMEGNILDANQNFLNTMGYTSDELKGKHHRIFVDPIYVQTPDYIEFWRNLQAGNVFTGEVLRYSKNRQKVWMQVSYAPVKNREGRYAKVIKLATDITAQKELEFATQQQYEELRAQEEELRQSMEEMEATQEEIERQNIELEGLRTAINSTLATIEFDPDGHILTANDNFLKTMGYPLADIFGKHHRIFVDPIYGNSDLYKEFWTSLRQGNSQIGEVKRFNSKGQEIWLSASYTPVFDQEKRVIKIIKFAQDITAQKRLTLDFENQLTAINRSFAVIEFNTKGEILTANENFLELMEYSLSEIQGIHHRVFVLEGQENTEEYLQFWEKLRQGEFVSGEFVRQTKTGRQVRIKGSYNPIFDTNGHVYKIVKYAQQLSML
ncbi:PAS domain-containing protein [Cytophagaceae bacterium DM2B3-1]|uniref:PAS domain-containing protein n=1 Tax=Xanthocytophaga flava TaxID=3048013 RepID=A0ABT7CVK2_9BACT|nr:PAS domain-containing protein [Xanthocytophaga flavus]MDJ1496957.1 PAS domain-containing protein [Xanthocytophaga flavus]